MEVNAGDVTRPSERAGLPVLLSRRQQGEFFMRTVASVLAVAGLLALGACNKSPADKAADNVRAVADNVADNIQAAGDNAASALNNRADAVQNTASNRADAVRNAADNRADRIESNHH